MAGQTDAVTPAESLTAQKGQRQVEDPFRTELGLGPEALIFGTKTKVIPFYAKGVLTSAAAATPVIILPESKVPDSMKPYVLGTLFTVSGATAWASETNVKLQDTNGTPVDFFTALVAALTANARATFGSANTTIENASALATGGTKGKGLQIVGVANGTGSDLYVSAWGYLVTA